MTDRETTLESRVSSLGIALVLLSQSLQHVEKRLERRIEELLRARGLGTH